MLQWGVTGSVSPSSHAPRFLTRTPIHPPRRPHVCVLFTNPPEIKLRSRSAPGSRKDRHTQVLGAWLLEQEFFQSRHESSSHFPFSSPALHWPRARWFWLKVYIPPCSTESDNDPSGPRSRNKETGELTLGWTRRKLKASGRKSRLGMPAGCARSEFIRECVSKFEVRVFWRVRWGQRRKEDSEKQTKLKREHDAVPHRTDFLGYLSISQLHSHSGTIINMKNWTW